MAVPKERAVVKHIGRRHIKIKSKLKTAFRSGPPDSDKVCLNLEEDEPRTRSLSINDVDQVKETVSPITGRKSDMEALKLALTRTAALQTQQLQRSTLTTAAEMTPTPADKKLYKKRPEGTIEYSVDDGDTLVGIGARFEVTPSELIKINKLLSRTVFVGQILYIPDPQLAEGSPSTTNGPSPVRPASAPQLEISVINLPQLPDHTAPAVSTAPPVDPVEEQITTDPKPHKENVAVPENLAKEEHHKFLKVPVRRLVDEAQKLPASEGFAVKGTLLVTPISIMFDPDVSDPVVISYKDQQKFRAVIYMEELKSAVLFDDISPRMFWRQSKEDRAHTPKPETFRSGQCKRSKVEGHGKVSEAKSEPSNENTGANMPETGNPDIDGDHGTQMDIGDTVDAVEREIDQTSENMEDLKQHLTPSETQHGVLLENLGHTLHSCTEDIPCSPPIRTSGSSEMIKCAESCMEDRDISGSPDWQSLCDKLPPEAHIPSSDGRVSELLPESNNSNSSLTDRTSSIHESHSSSEQGFQPIMFIDKSHMNVTGQPEPVPGQTVLVLSNSPITCTDVDEDIPAAETHPSEADNHEQVINNLDENQGNLCDFLCLEKPTLEDNSCNSFFYVPFDAQTSLQPDNRAVPNFNDKKPLLPLKKDVPGHSSSWSEKALTVVDKLASQVSNLTWESNADHKDGSPKSWETSPRTTFSPLQKSAHHVSNFFSYTTSLFQRPGSAEKDNSTAAQPLSPEEKSRLGYLPSNQLHLKSDFMKEDILKVLGPDPRGLLVRSDSCHFEDAPLYLQIRRGIRKNVELLQPRAFDHWNTGPLVNEYWFVVPREMGDKLYNFLMTWEPDAYGDEEETEPRGQFFYDVQSHGETATKLNSSGKQFTKNKNEDNGKELEKTWEILSKDEAHGAEKDLVDYRQDTIDESNIPELFGPTVIISFDHMLTVLKSLPRNMSVGYNWELVYATHSHGYSLQNLYMRTELVESSLPVLLFIMDTSGTVFGAFLSNTIRPSETFYGSGATFLFTFYPEFKKFSWCGDNQFFMHGTKEFFAVGSGEGLFGLWLDSSLDKGRSHPCTTFCNDVLAREEDFSILQLEVWKFVDSSLC